MHPSYFFSVLAFWVASLKLANMFPINCKFFMKKCGSVGFLDGSPEIGLQKAVKVLSKTPCPWQKANISRFGTVFIGIM